MLYFVCQSKIKIVASKFSLNLLAFSDKLSRETNILFLAANFYLILGFSSPSISLEAELLRS